MQGKDNEVRYDIKINTNLNNEMNLSIYIKDSKLFFICYFYKNYFKKTFSNSFGLDELKKSSSYFKQFNSENEILNEIMNNKYKGKENIKGNEETSNSIILVIPLPGAQFSSMNFELKEMIKTPEEIVKEYKEIVKQYENKFKFTEFNSKILTGKELEKETIKMWISPRKKLTTKLLYSYHDIPYKMTYDLFSKVSYYNNEFNESVRNFHKKCDGKKSILIICKSNKEIFGGYTPLSFNSSDEYGNDNESFLFSLNKLEKIPKDNHENTRSIWCYENYGPSFHYDLYFREGKINVVKYEKHNYLIYNKWINEDNCYTNDKGILLDSLEVFQIIDENNIYGDEDNIYGAGVYLINNNLNLFGNINYQGINYRINFESQEKLCDKKSSNSSIKNDDKKSEIKEKKSREEKEKKKGKGNHKEKTKEDEKN